ncbi:MAG: hypothetical protein U1A78_36810 [Polyangia bacterium]
MTPSARRETDRQPQPASGTGADTRVLPVLLFAAFLAALVGGCVLVCSAVLRLALGRDAREPPLVSSPASTPVVSAPRLQAFPQQDLDAMQRGKQQLLHGYGWQERGRGVVRVPITRALELAAERGLTTFAPSGPGDTTQAQQELRP